MKHSIFNDSFNIYSMPHSIFNDIQYSMKHSIFIEIKRENRRKSEGNFGNRTIEILNFKWKHRPSRQCKIPSEL